jgi:hypothetical protein
VSDATILIRDVAGDVASSAATKVKPSEDRLAQIDRPAEDNVWHEASDMSPKYIKGQVRSALDTNAPLSSQDMRDAAGNATQTAHPGDSRDPAEVARLAAQDTRYGGDSGVDAQSGAQAGVNTLRDRASDNIDDSTKDRVRETKQATKDKTRNYISSKMPEERRQQTIWRLKKMIVEIQGHPDYNSAITTLLNLAGTYTGHANNIVQQASETMQGAHADASLKAAEYDLKTLIERFANSTSTDDLFDSINQLYRDADKDPELKNWFKSVDRYIRKCLQEQGYILEDRASQEWERLYDQGNLLLRDRYRPHTDRLADEFKFLGDQFESDPLNRKFADSCQKLFQDLGNDENGNPTFKPHLVKDLTEVILPTIFENIRYVPIPRLEYSDPKIDTVIENLVIESDNLMPNSLEFASDNFFRWGRKNVNSLKKNAVMLSVSGIQMDLRDVSYFVKKKAGFPSLTDLGVADIFLGGSGFSFRIKASTAEPKDRQNFFKIDKVDVDVKHFNIKLKQSNHKFLFRLVKPLMLKVMRPSLQKVLEKMIRDKFAEFDQLLYSIKQEADRAQAEAQRDPENIPNIYSRYASTAQKKIMQGQKKTDQVKARAAKTKVNIAITQQNSIFPNIKLPGGISSKATEFKELAAKGDKWESPVFSIGSAKKSSNIPAADEIRRKKHNVASGRVRGPQNIGNTETISNQYRDPASQYSTQQGLNGPAGYGTNGSTAYADSAYEFSDPVGSGLMGNGKAANGGTYLGTGNPVLHGQ